jgi:adenylate kinase
MENRKTKRTAWRVLRMIIVMSGPQGSGKGVQAKKLEQEFGFKHVSTGDLLREEVKAKTNEGNEADGYMKRGEFVPFELNNKILLKGLEKNKEKTILLDGYPRYIAQAEFLLSTAEVKCMILLKVRDEVSIQRMSDRRICTANNKTFIASKITQYDIEECQNAGGDIIQRPDDKPAAIAKRLDDYHKETIPVVDFFKKKNIPVLEINGEDTIENVYLQIKSELAKILE